METTTGQNEKERPELRILMLEDVVEDAELAQHELRQNGIIFTAHVVDTRESFVTALQEFSPDIVLADYSLPSFNGLTALAIIREQYPDLPFIFVTGAVGEELTIEFLKKGATDYVLKDKLGRLPPAVERAIAERDERKELARTEKERARLSEAVGNIVEGVAIVSPELTFEYVNPGFLRMTGCSSDELLGKNVRALERNGDCDAGYDAVWEQVAAGSPWAGRLSHKRKDGTDTIHETTISSLRDASGALSAYVAVSRDVTQEVHLEERLRQAQKMEAIGTLAGGIAHDFNNILAAIIGFTELSVDDAPEGSLIKRNMNNVLKAGIRGRDLVKQILIFSHKSDSKRAPLHLSPVVAETFKLLRATTPTTVAMELRMNASSDEVLADPTEISQLLMNLGANAAYAMRDNGGYLEIALNDIEFRTDSHPPHPDLTPGAYVEVSIKDTGCGMDAATKSRIFEPFFTTKERGQGTGLGLAVVHGIVQSLGGAITVSSEPDRGTTFTVFLPKIAREEEAQPEMAQEVAGGTERVLFVDDEEMLVEIAREILGRLGYEVVATTDASEALRIFSAEPHRFHCVITDYTMPKATGVGLAKDLITMRPNIPIILCTGYTEMISRDEARALGIREFVMKPLVKREIAETIRRVLDSKAQD